MKVLLLSLSTGAGHNSCAYSLGDYFTEMGIENKFLDVYECISPMLNVTLLKGYKLTADHLSAAFGVFYDIVEKPKKEYEANLALLANSVLATKLLQQINEYKPDAIITTHILVGLLLQVLKRKGSLNAPCVAIMTDFTVPPYFECLDLLEYLVLPNELLLNRAVLKGISPSRLLTTGIPIRPCFSKYIPREEAFDILGIPSDKPAFLLMNGGYGSSHLDKFIKDLDSSSFDFNIISVCGSNKRAKQTVDKLKTKHTVYNYGFCDNIHVMMSAASAIITKPGGLTTSEALAKNLPIIINAPIPGQEERNSEFLLNNSVAMRTSKVFTIEETVFHLLYNKERLNVMKNNIALIKKPNATEDLCKFTLELVSGIQK